MMAAMHNLGYNLFLSTPSARRATFPVILHSGIRRFLSTPSARRATGIRRDLHFGLRISIHALREEGDFGGQI